MDSSAARTNLSSHSVRIHHRREIGEGQFRIAYAGTYIGGNRNNQEAVCKCFKPIYSGLEHEYFADDRRIIERALRYAEDWNEFCQYGKEILITYGSVMNIGGKQYLVEPLIRYFKKYTSNNGWIANSYNSNGVAAWEVEAMEAFTHYSYHKSGGQLIVCDLQGRYRHNRYSKNKSRFELTDPAICSRNRTYGPTDLGEKGIETFFSNHTCNKFCHSNNTRWSRPNRARTFFTPTSNTSMIRSSQAYLLSTTNRARFTSTLQPVYDNIGYDDSDSDDCSDDDYW